jgi:hypothetical protein
MASAQRPDRIQGTVGRGALGARRGPAWRARVLALYNFNTESLVLPAFSLRTDVTFPVGSLGGSDTHGP